MHFALVGLTFTRALTLVTSRNPFIDQATMSNSHPKKPLIAELKVPAHVKEVDKSTIFSPGIDTPGHHLTAIKVSQACSKYQSQVELPSPDLHHGMQVANGSTQEAATGATKAKEADAKDK